MNGASNGQPKGLWIWDGLFLTEMLADKDGVRIGRRKLVTGIEGEGYLSADYSPTGHLVLTSGYADSAAAYKVAVPK